MKNIHNIRPLLLALILTTSQPMFGQLTIESCHQMARENFPLIRQYELIEQTQEYTLSNANKSYLPQLDITLIGGVISGLPSFSMPGTEPSSASDFNAIAILQLNQTIWDGGMTKARKGIGTATAVVDKAALEVTLFELEKRVNNLFFGVLLLDEQLKQLQILRSTLQRNADRVKVAVENGTAFRSDVDEAMVEVINTSQKIETLRSNRDAYMQVLGAMTGHTFQKDEKLVVPTVDTDIIGLENKRPELALFQSQHDLLQAKNDIDQALVYPKIGILGFGAFIRPGAEFGTSTLQNVLVGGISINWSLGSLYRDGNNKKLTEVSMADVALREEAFLFNSNMEQTQMRIALKKYEKLIAQDREMLALKSRIKKAYDTKYENGICTMAELLNRTNEESMARQNLVVHEIEYLMKIYEYRNTLGY
jgi:outer membrane protein TolC